MTEAGHMSGVWSTRVSVMEGILLIEIIVDFIERKENRVLVAL